MAKKAKKAETTKRESKLRIVNPDAAGVDIADGVMQVCVPVDRCEDSNREFKSFTCDLREISKWLKECRIQTVAMESTGVYWMSLYFMLQDDGFDVVLTNAKDIKKVTDRKTDESDAEWLMTLHQYGLLKNSFQPFNDARSLRTLTRHRDNLVRSCATTVQRMQKSMQQMNIKLSVVLSDITGKSGIAIIEAMLRGERDPYALSLLADKQCKASYEEIAKALEGTWEEDHMFTLKQNYDMYRYLCEQVKDCDKRMEDILSKYRTKVIAESCPKQFHKSNKQKKYIPGPQIVGFDVEKMANDIWGVNVFQIPGMGPVSTLELISELGHDFVNKFETSKHFCSWCNIAPNTKISGGKKLSSHLPHRRNRVGLIFRTVASSLARAKNELGNYYRRIRSRAGGRAAVIATAHKVAEIFYTMIKKQEEYVPSKVGVDEKTLLEKRISRYSRELEKIKAIQLSQGLVTVP